MCGIVGVVRKHDNGFVPKNDDCFFEMLYADVVRGPDSTGVVGVDKHGGFYTAKEAFQAALVIPDIKELDWYKNTMSGLKSDGKAWIGHNRKSTVGKTNDQNAHPFTVNGEFSLVHNGTLTSHKHLADVEVDSQALAIAIHAAMGKDDWKTALEETLGKVNGAYALAWYDARHEKVYLLRNFERPLSVWETDDAYYFASEAAMAWWILMRNEYKADACKHIQIAPHTLFEFNVKPDAGKWSTGMTTTEIVPKKAKPQNSTTTKSSGDTVHIHTFGVRTSSKGKGGGSTSCSKKELKQFRHLWLNKSIRFWVKDYVEREFSKKFPETSTSLELLLMGESDSIYQQHIIKTTINTGTLELKTVEDILERQWLGRIQAIHWDEGCGWFEIMMEKCKPVVLSKAPAPAAANDPPFEPDKPKWPFPSFPGKSPARELAETTVKQYIDDKIKSYQEQGIEVIESVINGKVVLINKANMVQLYESPIVLH